ncbi:Hypothetical predicted protein [Pelobates cultripes]|uniref:Uncharacterized protein n=1 Tax=Pelobates cultripes TaxID=61616 RepID=A0AAD1SF15_PELCU|nr:Hypothetical predicted protein [Pelobates cultripes]
MMALTPTQPQSTSNAPRHTGEMRRSQLDLRTVMEDMRAAEERQQEGMENLSEQWFQALRQDAQEAMCQEAEIARQQMEQLTTLGSLFRRIPILVEVFSMTFTKIMKSTASKHHGFDKFNVTVIPLHKTTPPTLKSSECIFNYDPWPGCFLVVGLLFRCQVAIVRKWFQEPIL